MSDAGTVNKGPPEGGLPLNTVLSETISMLGVSIGIVVAGLGIFAPLYIFLWQSLSDSLFSVFDRARKECEERRGRGVLGPQFDEFVGLREKACKHLKILQSRAGFTAKIFGCTIWGAIGLLVLLATAVVIPVQEYAYIVAAGSVLIAIALAIMFLYLVLLVQRLGPARVKLEIQRDLAQLLNDEAQVSPESKREADSTKANAEEPAV